MKKMLTVMCCIVFLAFCLAGCGGKKDLSDSQFTGTWNATTCEYEGFEMNVSDIVGDFILVLNPDGSFNATVGEDDQSGKWEEIENGVKLDGDEEMTFTNNGGVLELNYDDVLMHFEKQ